MTLNAIKNFIKTELRGWKTFELVFLSSIVLLILINAFIVKDSIFAVINAVCGILYTFFAGKGKISCYFYGLAGTGCYSYLALSNGLYGNLLLYAGYYLPMQILGVFSWKKHLQKKTNVIEKTRLSNKDRILFIVITLLLIIFMIAVLKYFRGNSPYFDGITTVLSVVGMLLTVKRCIEQWFVWMIVNGLSAIMWLEIILNGTKAYSTLIMWIVYFFLAIYFYNSWNSEIRNNSK